MKILSFHELKVFSECSSDLQNYFPLSGFFNLSTPLKKLNSLKMSIWGSTALNFGLEKIPDLPVKVSVRIFIPVLCPWLSLSPHSLGSRLHNHTLMICLRICLRSWSESTAQVGPQSRAAVSRLWLLTTTPSLCPEN